MKEKSDIGLIGLAVMGENLILNMAARGFTVTAFNRSTERVTAFTEHFRLRRREAIKGSERVLYLFE